MVRTLINQERMATSPIVYHKGWIKDKTRYKVLVAHKLPKQRVEHAQAAVKTLVTGTEAQDFVVNEARTRALAGLEQEWQYINMDPEHRGRAGILRYRGVEIALFFKRAIMEIEPGIGEKPPEMQITDPADAWQRLDLLGHSAKRANAVLKKYHTELETLVQAQAQEITSWKAKLAAVEDRLNAYVRKEERAKEIAAEKAAKELAKKHPKRKKRAQDRLCMICKCYENVHNFDKKGNCLGCDGGKAECQDCTFRPKGTRKRRITGNKVVKKRRK
jgi:hypothetical protein